MKYHAYVAKTIARTFNVDSTVIELCLLLADEKEMTYEECTRKVLAVADSSKYIRILEYEGLLKMSGRRIAPSIRMKDAVKKYYRYMDNGVPISSPANPIVSVGRTRASRRGDRSYVKNINLFNEDIKRRKERYRRYGLQSLSDQKEIYAQLADSQIGPHYPE